MNLLRTIGKIPFIEILFGLFILALVLNVSGFIELNEPEEYTTSFDEPAQEVVTQVPLAQSQVLIAPTATITVVPTPTPWASSVEVGIKYACDVTNFVKYSIPIEVDGITFENTIEKETFVSTHLDNYPLSALQIRTSREGEFLRGIAFIQRRDGYTWVGVSNPDSSEVEGPWLDVQTAYITLRFVNTTEPVVAIYYLPYGLKYDRVLWTILPESEFGETCEY